MIIIFFFLNCTTDVAALVASTNHQFAIRVNLRNSTLRRDDVIRQVAAAVGPGRGHSVDLKNYDVLILVEIYKVRALAILRLPSLQ